MKEAWNKEEIDQILQAQELHWKNEGKSISKTFTFENFTGAFSFMTAIAIEAEKMNHHPDWENSYNRVKINLSTHSAGGVTQQDIDLALKIEKHDHS